MLIENVVILAIDDNRDNLITLKAVLMEVLPQATLLTALNGPQGLEIAKQANPDVILLDIVMPGMDGFEVCRTLKQDQNLQVIPVLFLTALKTNRFLRYQALEAGAEGFLSKPLDEVELMAQTLTMAKIKQANLARITQEERLTKLVEERTKILQQEIVERKLAEEKYKYLSMHDYLTGLYNRISFAERIQNMDNEVNLPLTIVLADINGLNMINNAFGSKAGDNQLVRTAEILKKNFRPGDFIARIGGDEFLVLMGNTKAREAEAIIKNIRKSSNTEKNRAVKLSISFGVATKNEMPEDINDILKRAENDMNRRKLFENPSALGNTIYVIIKTLHEKNKREERHSQRVSQICEAMGIALGMTDKEVNELKTVGLMHDIGKIATSEAILNKVDNLTENEWLELKLHPEVGYRILGAVHNMSDLAEYVLAHHERVDGKGYPKGLRAEEIPIQSRIIAIADAYDAITSARAYRNCSPVEAAITELRKNSGTQFDAHLVNVFVEKVLGSQLYDTW